MDVSPRDEPVDGLRLRSDSSVAAGPAVLQTPSADGAATLTAATTATQRARRLRGVRILVVDDHLDTLEFLSQALSQAGAAVVTAASARDAVRWIGRVDAIVTDYSMPGETGIWLLEQVRGHGATPVLALTGFAPSQDEALAAARFTRILLKPIEMAALCEEIAAAVHGRDAAA